MRHVSQEQLVDYLHHALAPEDDALVHAHLDGCASCRLAFQDEAALSDALRAHAQNDARDLPDGVAASIWATVDIDRRRESTVERLLQWLRPAVLVPALAVVAIVFLLLPHVSRTAPAQTIDAAYYLQDHAALASTMPFADENQVPAALESDDEGQVTAVAVLPAMVTADAAP